MTEGTQEATEVVETTSNDTNITEVHEEGITGYEIARRINTFLEKHGKKSIPPQMMYNYIKSRQIRSNNGRVSESDAKTYAVAHLARKNIKVTDEQWNNSKVKKSS